MRKVMHMGGHWWGRALAVLGLLVGVAAIAAFAFHAGTLQSGGFGAMHAGGGPEGMMYGRAGFGHSGGFFGGFILLRVLFGLFFLFLILRIARFAIFGPRHWGRWGYGPMGWGGPMGPMTPGGAPTDPRHAMFEDWHRQMHGDTATAAPASAASVAPVAPAADEAAKPTTANADEDEPKA